MWSGSSLCQKSCPQALRVTMCHPVLPCTCVPVPRKKNIIKERLWMLHAWKCSRLSWRGLGAPWSSERCFSNHSMNPTSVNIYLEQENAPLSSTCSITLWWRRCRKVMYWDLSCLDLNPGCKLGRTRHLLKPSSVLEIKYLGAEWRAGHSCPLR